MPMLRNLSLLAGRVLIAAIFIYDSTLLVHFPDADMAFMEKFGLPGFLLWPTAAFQFVGGVLIVAGLATRATALLFAGFCALTALTFHRDFASITELIQFGKDFGLCGGFLFLLGGGAGALSVDSALGTDFWPISRRSGVA